MNLFDVIYNRLEELINEGNTKLVLYPFGEQGKLAKVILNTYFGINELAIVDNIQSEKYSLIYNTKKLKMMDLTDAKVLLTVERTDIKKELIDNLHREVAEIEVLELFTEEYRTRKENEILEKKAKELEIRRRASLARKNVLKKVNSCHLIEKGMIYSPKKVKSSFFLPYVYMDAIQRIIFLSDDYYEGNFLRWIFFEWESGRLAQFISNSKGIIVDIGANIGNHSLFFANELEAKKVIAFEPIEETFWILEENIKLNGLENRVELHKKGLSSIQGMAQAKEYNYDNVGGTGLDKCQNGDIELTTLDSFGLSDVSFIKIDVEGMEIEVLNGAMETIDKSRPYIMVEAFGEHFNIIHDMLSKLGYASIELPGENYLFYCE